MPPVIKYTVRHTDKKMTKIPKGISGIYRVYNTVNRRGYVGSAKSLRGRLSWHRQHLRAGDHFNQHLQRAWNKHGEEAFQFQVIEVCNLEKLIEREQYWIDTLEAANPEFGYNGRPKAESTLGMKHTPEFCARHSEIMKQFYEDPENRAKTSERMLEVWRDPDFRASQTDKMKEVGSRPEIRAARKKVLTRPDVKAKAIEALQTPEARTKNSESMTELWADPDHRAKMVAAHLARCEDPAERERLRECAERYYAEHPEAREAISETQLAVWADEDYKIRMKAIHKASCAEGTERRERLAAMSRNMSPEAKQRGIETKRRRRQEKLDREAAEQEGARQLDLFEDPE